MVSQKIIASILVGYLSLFVALFVMRVWQTDLNIPFRYSGDSLYYSALIKTIQETGWVNKNDKIGAPEGFDWRYYPEYADNLNILLIKLISSFGLSWGATLNIFYLLTFVLVGASSYMAMTSMGINSKNAAVFSILFSNLPYHYIRGVDHLFLSSYFVVPLVFLLIFRLFSNKSHKLTNLLICAILASTGLYYAYFGLFLLFVLTIVGMCKQNSTLVIKSAIYGSFTLVIMLINYFPSIALVFKENGYQLASDRLLEHTERYGLKIIDLLLPIDHHRIGILNRISEKYTSQALLINENRTASLGIVAAIGFFLSIYGAFTKKNKPLWLFGIFSLSLLVLSTIGGIGEIISLLTHTTIRSFNRASTFIAFISFACFALTIQKKWPSGKKLSILLFIILGVGLFDQTSPAYVPWHSAVKQEFLSDKRFVKAVEESLPSESMVFQFPHTYFPESPDIDRIGPYDSIRMYLHSENIKWSYGSLRGSGLDTWLSKVNISEAGLRELSKKGYIGIVTDKFGFDMELKGYSPIIISPDRRFTFYNLD